MCAVDCGIAVNPDVIRAQMEGGIGYRPRRRAARAQITLEDGAVVQTQLRHATSRCASDEMPDVEVHIVPSTETPTGVGEPGVPPIAPAVANAYRAATGKTVTVLPFAKGLAV